MKQITIKVSLFIAINLLIYSLIVSIPRIRYSFEHYTSESNLLAEPHNETYDLLLLGTSHPRIFARNGNHERVEHILSRHIANISKGGGHGGVFPELLFLSRFYENGNHARTALYFIDPWVFYSREWNEGNYFLGEEPFDLRLFAKAIKAGADRSTVIDYVQSKLGRRWILLTPATRELNVDRVPSVAAMATACQKEIQNSYMNGLDHESFVRYTNMLEETVTLAEQQHTRVTFLFPTSLCENVPGKNQVMRFLEELKQRHHIEIHDFSKAMDEPQYFYDYNHLNSAGVEFFTEKYLLPIFGERAHQETSSAQRDE